MSDTQRTDAQACKNENQRPMTADEVDAQWRNWCVIEVMVRNPAVNERICYLERDLAAAKAKIAALEQKRLEDVRKCEDICLLLCSTEHPLSSKALEIAAEQIRAAFPDDFKEQSNGTST